MNDDFKAGLMKAVEIINGKEDVHRYGIREGVPGIKDSYDRCSHQKYRYEHCYHCLAMQLEGIVLLADDDTATGYDRIGVALSVAARLFLDKGATKDDRQLFLNHADRCLLTALKQERDAHVG